MKLGVGSKFSNLLQVGDFSIFGSKSSFSREVGGIKFEFWWGVLFLTRHLQCPSGVQAKASKHEAEGRVEKFIKDFTKDFIMPIYFIKEVFGIVK